MENHTKIEFIKAQLILIKDNKSDMEFFLKFRELVRNIKEWKEFKILEKEAYSTKELLDQENEKLHKLLLKRVELEGKKIWDYIIKNGLSKITFNSSIEASQYPLLGAGVLENKENLDYFLIQIKGYYEGKITSNTKLGWSLKNIYGSIIQILYSDYDKIHRHFAKKFVRLYKDNEDFVEDFLDLKEWKEYYEFQTKKEAKEKTEFWHMVYYVCEIYKGMNTEFVYEEFTDLSYLSYISSFEWDAIKKRDNNQTKYYSNMYPDILIFKTEMILNNIQAKLISSKILYSGNSEINEKNSDRIISKKDISKEIKKNKVIYKVKNTKTLVFTIGTQPEKLFKLFFEKDFSPISLVEIHREVFYDLKTSVNISSEFIKEKIKGIKFSKNTLPKSRYKVSTSFLVGMKEFSLTMEKVK